MESKTRHLYEFGRFRLDPQEAVLLRDGKPVYLKPKVLETLIVLVENRGRILDKESLMRQLWQDTFVEEANLTVNISQLRKALGESADGSPYIETLPRRGYRFVAEVREVWAEEAALVVKEYTTSRITIEEKEARDEPLIESPSEAEAPLSLAIAKETFLSRLSQRKGLLMAAAAALVVIAVGLWFYWRHANREWARGAIPQVEELARAERYSEAYDLALKVKKVLPNDPALARLMPMISDDLSVASEPAGARVYLKRYTRDDSGQLPPRQLIGTTPISHLQIARDEYIIEVEKDGYAPIRRSISSVPAI